MFEYLKTNWPALSISAASLLLSFIIYLKNKKVLDVIFEEKLLNPPTFSNGREYVSHTNGIYISCINVINPSPSDIAYFDLTVKDTKDSSNSFKIYDEAFIKSSGGDISRISCSESSGNSTKLNPSATDHGVFKSNSFTRFHIIFAPKQHPTEEVTITFKVAIKSRLRNPVVKYKHYTKTYALKDK